MINDSNGRTSLLCRVPEIIFGNRSKQCGAQGLRHAIRIVDSWDDSVDVELICGFLDHPAAMKTSDEVIYMAREAAKDALVRRKLPVPDNVITREEIKRTKSD